MKAIEPFKLSVQQVGEVTGESASIIQDAVKAGHLRSFLVGRRRFFRPNAVKEWIDLLEARSDAGMPVAYRARACNVDTGKNRHGQRSSSAGRSVPRSEAGDA